MAKEIPVPKVGQEIYVPSAFYIDHGRDDFAGGKATISKVKPMKHTQGRFWVAVQENPSADYSWEYIYEGQEEWAKEYGEEHAHPDPDMHPESNPPNYGWND